MTGKLLGSLVFALAVSAGPVHAATDNPAVQKTAAIVLPVDFKALKKSVDGLVPMPEVQSEATAQLERSLKLAFARIGAFEPVPPPAMSAAESATLDEHLTLIKMLVMARVYDDHPRSAAPPNFSVGKGLSFLAERTGTERLIYVYGFKLSNPLSVVPLIGAVEGQVPLLLGAGSAYGMTKNTQLAVVVIELRSGDIRWMNFQEDINADVTERGGANAYMLPTFGNYPKTALADPGTAKNIPASQPVQDSAKRYSLQTVAGWRRVPGLPFASTPGLLLNKRGPCLGLVSIRRHMTTGPLASPRFKVDAATDPVELGGRMIESLKADYKPLVVDTHGIEAVTVSGSPAFRADFTVHEKVPGSADLRVRHRLYGVVTATSYFLLDFTAPAIHYFDLDVAEFEAMVATFEIRKSS